MSLRPTWIAVGLAVVLTACGSESLTVAEYAAEVEELVATMEARFATLDGEWEAQPPSVEGAERYWEGRLGIREWFLGEIEDLDAPDEIGPMHTAALDVFTRITEADEALAERAAGFETITEHWQWVDTPEGAAADAVLEDVYAFCRASQEEFDATGGDEFAEVPWIPVETVEAIKVAFGCPP